jgi:hypothetical protein
VRSGREGARARILAIRMAGLALAGLAVVLAFALGARSSGRRLSAAGRGAPSRGYACAMHPEIRTEAPGRCPLCGMTLVPVPEAGAAAPVAASPEVSISPAVVAHGRRIVRAVERRSFPRTFRVWVESITPRALVARLSRDVLECWPREGELTFHAAAAPSVAAAVVASSDPGPPPGLSDPGREALLDAGGLVRRWLRVPPRAAPMAVPTVGWVDLPACAPPVAVLPAEAVLDDPVGPYVLVARPDGHGFDRRRVELGRPWPPYETITEGVSIGEQVVTLGSALFDAERGLTALADPGP